MFSKLRKENKGFTIIEVLIVLAIAGLIMLIVFLAVPALQRNSRNTGRTSDASRMMAGVSNWIANNNGATFTAGTGNANITAVLNDVGTLGQYTLTSSNFLISTGASAVAAIANTTDMRVVTGAQCGTSGATVPGTPRQIALQYALETSSGTPNGACING